MSLIYSLAFFSRSRTKEGLKKHVSHIGAAPKIPVCLSSSLICSKGARKKSLKKKGKTAKKKTRLGCRCSEVQEPKPVKVLNSEPPNCGSCGLLSLTAETLLLCLQLLLLTDAGLPPSFKCVHFLSLRTSLLELRRAPSLTR